MTKLEGHKTSKISWCSNVLVTNPGLDIYCRIGAEDFWKKHFVYVRMAQ